MTYTGLELFMDNLKQLIYNKDNPLINHQSVLCARPQINLLYKELGSMIQILFVDNGHNLVFEPEHVRGLKKRFVDVAEEAHDIIDLFVSGVHYRDRGHFLRCDVFKPSLNLEEVMRLFKSIKVEFITMITNNMTMGSSITTDSLHMQPVGSFRSRNPLEKEKFLEEIVVGIDQDAELIRDKLVEDQKKLDVVSIVGMGGIGKTTLATKVYNDPFVVYHFHARAWVTVSQTYEKRIFLIETLVSLGVELDPVNDSYSRLREILHKRLMGIRFLIVIDDIWSIEAWADLKLFFPNEITGSRILITTRLTEVALHANRHGFVYFLPYLTEEKSWELLSKKVFHGDEIPEQLIKPGKRIAERCQGLPLAILVIAGILAKEPLSKDLWEKISDRVNSYIVSDHNGYLETLALSYQHLPLHLRHCFLYLGGFPENAMFSVRNLIWLWVAEGFIQEDGRHSLEDIAESYLMDLVDRNLVIVAERKFNGGVKACKLHDLVRNLCLEKADEERFFLKIEKTNGKLDSYTREVLITYKQRRVFTNQDIYIVNFTHPHKPTIRTLFGFQKFTSSVYDDAEYLRSFALLRVLDLQKCELNDFPHGIRLLVHLRYLAIWHLLGFPSSICNLWSLRTLIIKTSHGNLVLPSKISNLVNLRHLRSDNELYLPSIEKPMNLQTISYVVLGDGIDNFQKCFPSIKKLASPLYSDEENDFESLPYLETLKLTGWCKRRKSTEANICGKNLLRFPATLKKLTIVRCYLVGSDMSVIQSLPNLEVLKLMEDAYDGTVWNIGEKEFRRLKFLRLEGLNIKHWEAYSINFPCLKQLQLVSCIDLEEIPLDIGEIPTLELIEINGWTISIVKSLEKIQEQQHDVGNFELKIDVDGMELSFLLSTLKDNLSVLTSTKAKLRWIWASSFLIARLSLLFISNGNLQFPKSSKKVVLKLDYEGDRIKRKAMITVSRLPGLESLSLDMKDKKLRVTGYVDPITILSKLRNICYAEIVSIEAGEED